VRPVFWGLALAALLVLGCYLAINSRQLQDRVAREVEARAAAWLGRPVSIGSLRFELLPLTVQIDDLVVGGRTAEEAPLAVLPRATVDAQLFWRDRLRLELSSVRLEEPLLNFIFDPGRGSNLAGLGRRRAASGPRRTSFEFALEELTIDRGTLVIDHQRLPLDLSARGLSGRLWGTAEPQFAAQVRELEVTLPRARPYLGAATVRGRLDGRTLEILHARIAGPDLTVATTGRFRFGADRRGALEVAVETGDRFLRQAGYVQDQVAGEFDFGGTVFWDADGWGLQGALAAASVRVLNFPLRRLEGVLNGDREMLELKIQGAEYADGGLTGAVRVDLEPGGPPTVAIDLELSEVDFEQLLAGQGWPVAGVAATVSGPFSYGFGWRQPDRGAGWASLEVSGREAAGVAFTGAVPLLIEDGVFRTTAVRLDSESHHIQASGAYDLDRRAGRFRFRVATQRVEQLLPLLRFAGDPEDLWRPTGGRGRIGGSLTVAAGQTRVELRLDLEEVRSPGAAADQLHGSLGIDNTGIGSMRLELLRPDAGLIVTGSLPFSGPADGPQIPFELTVDAAGWPLQEARAWLPFEVPVEGPAFGALRLEGSFEEPRGSARLTVRPATVLEIPVAQASADLEFDSESVRFRELELAAAAGTIAAAGRWDRGNDELAIDVASAGLLDLARQPFSDWWSGALRGRAELDGFVAGTLAMPHLSGRLDAVGLELADRLLGDRGVAGLEVSWRQGRVAALGSILGLVEVNGGGRLDEQAVDLDLAVEAPDLPALADLFGLFQGVEFGGSGAGRLRVSGRPASDQSWRTGLELDRLDLEYGGRRLSAARPVEVVLAPDGVLVQSLYLVEAATGNDLFVFGTVGLGEGAALDLRLQGSVDSVMVAPFLPGFDISGGRFDLLAVVDGSPAAPRINGQGEVRGARVVLGGIPPLEGVRGVVLFYPGRLVLDRVDGRLGGGRVRISGGVELPREDRDVSYNVQVRGERVTLRYPEGWELRGDADLTVASVEQGRQVRGAVTLDRAQYLRQVEVGLTQLLQTLFQRRRLEVESTDEELTSTQLNLAISGPGALRVRNNVANLRGDVDLALRGSLAVPVLFGRLDLEPGGTLQIGGSDYTVERGSLIFANPYRMEPVIDLAARTRRRDYDLSLSLSGTTDRLDASLASDPPLADLDVLGLLATGEPAAVQGPAQGAEAFLYGQAASLVTERVNRLFGLDRFRIDPLTGTSGSPSSARVTLGKQLSRDLLATYSYDPSLTEQQILQLEWTVARGLTLVATQNGDGTYAVDARWEKSF
jgi:hypothetical protein